MREMFNDDDEEKNEEGKHETEEKPNINQLYVGSWRQFVGHRLGMKS